MKTDTEQALLAMHEALIDSLIKVGVFPGDEYLKRIATAGAGAAGSEFAEILGDHMESVISMLSPGGVPADRS